MRSTVKATLFVFLLAVPAFAQNYPYPRAQSDPSAICSGCPGSNSSGEPNDGLPTVPYDTPLQLHTGRVFDSSSTIDSRAGMRTIRGGAVRVAGGANRIYLGLGATIGAYTLDAFFTEKLQQGMVAVNTIPTGKPYSGRNPFEKLAKPDRFFYPEHTGSGWNIPLVDVQAVLGDFDVDDRNSIYLGTLNFGWGIVSDPGGTDGSHLPSVKQVQSDSMPIHRIVSLRSGDNYYVYLSNLTSTSRIYDVTAPAAPVLLATRTGTANAIRNWSKYEAGQRVAVRNGDGHVRIYAYADLIAGGTALADVTPNTGRQFNAVSFDSGGNLWIAEGDGNSSGTNVLWKLAPSMNGYTTTTYSVYGNTPFSATHIHAGAGYVAVGGTVFEESFLYHDLRLLQVVSGTPVLVDTNSFFLRYYDRAPSGFAEPLFATNLQSVAVMAQGAKTYLFYNAYGLGDVYEIGSGPRITSIAPLSGIPAGGTNVSIYGSGFAAGSTVTFDGVLASSTFVDPTRMTAASPMHASGMVDVIVSPPGGLPMTSPDPFTYELTVPQQFVATATSTTSVGMSWNSVAGATYYEVSRRSPDGTWIVIGTPSSTSLNDDGRTAETTYVYRVRAADAAANFSAYSAMDLASTISSDVTVTGGAPILASHLAQIRTRVNAVRAAAGLSASSFSGGGVGDAVLATHITDLRASLNQARVSLGFATAAFTDGSLSGFAIKALHLNQMLDLTR